MSEHTRKSLPGILGMVLLFSCLPATQGDPETLGKAGPGAAAAHGRGLPSSPLWVLLSDNDEPTNLPRVATGCTYTYDKPPTNPADVRRGTKEFGRRLLDGDKPYDDWNARIGINYTDLTITFDLKRSYPLAEAAIKLSPRPLPAAIEVACADSKGGPWQALGTIKPDPQREGWVHLPLARSTSPLPKGRFVRLVCRLHKWGFYVAEVRIYGLPADEPTGAPAFPRRRRDGRLVLVEQGKPTATIVIAADAPVKVASAARDLQEYLRRITGAALPVRTDRSRVNGNLILVGKSALTAKLGVAIPSGYWLNLNRNPPTPEGFVIRTIKNALVLAGNDDGNFDGTACAVSAFLETLGVRWYAPDSLYEVVPRKTTVAVSLHRREQPAFAYRRLGGYTKTREQRVANARWLRRLRCGGVAGDTSHSYFRLFPPKKFGSAHPEYYAMADGRRREQGEWQVCTTNPDVVRLAARESLDWLNADRRRVFFSLSPNDSGGFCQCNRCNQLGELHEPGAAAMRILTFANEVLERVRKQRPDAFGCFYAYWYTFAPPSDGLPRRDYVVRARPGVIVVLIDEGCHAHRLDDPACARNRDWLNVLKRWKQIVTPERGKSASGRVPLFLYEWLIPDFYNKAWLQLPWQCPEWATSNLNLWQREGVLGVTYESQSVLTAPNRWLMVYTIARRLWNQQTDAKVVRREACQRLFGKAAAPMERYFIRLERAVAESPDHVRIWHLPDPKRLFTPEVIARCRALLRQALSVAKSELSRRRVSREMERFDAAVQAMTK